MSGFDCATPLTKEVISKFVADGFTFTCRYLAPKGSWKRLTAEESQRITDGGLWIVSVFERSADNALKGESQGIEDGLMALNIAKEILQPEGTVIYAAVDTDINSSHYDVIEAYLRAFDKQITGYELGIYGEKDICEEMRNRGVVSRVWQTKAWSKGQIVDDYNIYQYDLGVTGLGLQLNGIMVDLNMSNGDAGGWKVGMAIDKNYLLSKEDADQIESILSDYWHRMEGNKEIQDFTHYLANQVRIASGQEPE
jgi:hypothetical protein